jgi:nicotinamide-nucleotide amidase
VERHVIDLIQKVMNRPASQINKDQALVPSKCTVLHQWYRNCGMDEKENTVFISLPGVPYEMRRFSRYEIIPKVVR